MVLARTLETSLLLALSAKSKAVRLLVSIRGLRSLPAKAGGVELGGGKVSDVRGERTGTGTGIAACSPNADATLALCVLSEDEAERHVQAGHREEEKGSDERELVDAVRQNRGSDTKKKKGAIPTIRAQLRTTSMAKRRKKTDVQSLEDPERAKAKLRTEHGEKAIEEGHRPGHLG